MGLFYARNLLQFSALHAKHYALLTVTMLIIANVTVYAQCCMTIGRLQINETIDLSCKSSSIIHLTYKISSIFLQAYLLLEALGHVAPVDDLPDGAEVLRLAVLVLQVVGVLPGVNAHERLEVTGDGVLVGAGDKTEGARGLVLDEPGPAGTLNAGEGSVGLLFEVLEGAEVLVDGSLSNNTMISIVVQSEC